MAELLKWITSNSEQLIAIVTSVVATCSVIAAATPTPKDDSAVKTLYKIIDFFALNFGFAKDR